MKNLFRILSVLVLVVTAFGVAAPLARPVAAQGETTICFAFQDLETQFWVAGHKAITETLRAQGVKVIEVNGNQDANKQLEQVQDCIAQGVNGIIMIPQDGESAVTIIGKANEAGVPIAIFNRPPAPGNPNPAIVVVADNKVITEQAVDYMVHRAIRQVELTGKKAQPLIMVGDLGDPNAVGRRDGFYAAVNKYPEFFETPIEVPTKWDANTALANLQSALQANPNIDMLFTSSDFMYPQIQSVLEPLGKWKKMGEPGHVILGGLDGDALACKLMKEGYVDATGVQDLYYEAKLTLDAILKAIADKEGKPNQMLPDPGFALTQLNIGTREMDMWGCKLFAEGFLDKQ